MNEAQKQIQATEQRREWQRPELVRMNAGAAETGSGFRAEGGFAS
jgi:hypothetical protein